MLGLRKALITGAVSVALVAGGTAAGAAIASGPVDSAGVIHGCWTNAAINGTHVFVLQDAGTSCPKGTTAISWNQTPPAGPAGATGATGPAGPAGPIGNTGPAGPAGAPGPTGPAGPQGPIGNTGPPGPAGANGSTVLNGTGAPASTVGNDGDFYIDTAADVLYGPKAGGSWPAPGISLVGNPGPVGAQGPAGDTGPAGPQGPAGPPGPPGAGSLSSLDSLGGLDCNIPGSGHGTVEVTYGTGGSVSLSCVGPYTYKLTAGVTAFSQGPQSCGPFGQGTCPGNIGAGTITSTPGGMSCFASGDGDSGAAQTNSCTVGIAPGTQVTLTESVSQGSFGGWGGACASFGQAPTCTITMNADTQVTADFGL